MTALLSFHGDKKVKHKYLTRVRAHAKADEIVKGHYWQHGKGCAVGCTIHGRNHSDYETELGIPEWLARLEDNLFENLPNGTAKSFPAKFLAAIPVGKNLEPVKWRFAFFLLSENAQCVKSLKIDAKLKKQVLDAIEKVAAVNRRAIEVGELDEAAGSAAWSAARSAAEAAWSAAEAAESAAWSAAWSAAGSAARSAAEAAESAAWSAAEAAWSAARSAAEAAWSAARSAAEAAWSAARSAAYVRYSEKLLELLRAA